MLTVFFMLTLCGCNQASSQTNEFISRSTKSNDVQFFDGWVYYLINGDLKKCKSDLSDDTLLEKDIKSFDIYDSKIYIQKSSQTQENLYELFVCDLNKSEFKMQKITDFKSKSSSQVVFYDNLILSKYVSDTDTERLELFNKDGASKDIIAEGNLESFGIVDESIYYHLNNEADTKSIVEKYDIATGKRTEVLKFDKTKIDTPSFDYFQPKVFYDMREIIVQKDSDSFLYIDIDSTEQKTVSFDLSKYEQGMAKFIFSDSENLYFETCESYDVDNISTVPCEIYIVHKGEEKASFVNDHTGDNILFLYEGYLYYLTDKDSTNNWILLREKFIETDTASVLPQIQHGGIYKNEALGFQLTFPSSWDKHFATRQIRDGYIAVIFWGESDTAKTQAYNDASDIPFFYLATESDFIANVGEGSPSKMLGKGKYENIYKVGNFDYPTDNLEPEPFKGKITETELKKIEKDYAKAKEMLAQVDSVLKSFASLS